LAVTIRLRRLGAKKRPIYRLVAIDSRRAREGRFIDMMGYYNPIVKPATISIDQDKVFGWLKQGAQPSDTVHSLFSQIGVNEKWNLMKQGKDATGIEIKTFITERKKRSRKAKAASVTTEGEAAAGEKKD
jgi:small subunit ribosomal protein S16